MQAQLCVSARVLAVDEGAGRPSPMCVPQCISRAPSAGRGKDTAAGAWLVLMRGVDAGPRLRWREAAWGGRLWMTASWGPTAQRGDHFSMFAQMHAAEVRWAMLVAIAVLKVRSG